MSTVLFVFARVDETSLINLAIASVLVLGSVIYKTIAANKARKAQVDQATQNYRHYQLWRNDLTANGGKLPEVQAPILLNAGERCFFARHGLQLCEPRAVRNYNHTGGYMRVARGISIGKGRSTSESHDEWRAIATGSLYITDQRIIFEGDMQSRSLKISDLISCHNGGTFVSLISATRQKTIIINKLNGYITCAIITAAMQQNTPPKT